MQVLIAWLVTALAIVSSSCAGGREAASGNQPSPPSADIVTPDPTAPLGLDGEKVTLHTGTNEDVLEWEATLQDSGCSPVPVPDSDLVGQSCSFDPFRRVKLNSGIVALLSERGGLTSLSLVEPPHESGGIAIDPDLNLYVDIYGSTQLSGEEAIQLADSLAGGHG